MRILKQSTVTTIPAGVFVDAIDGKTLEAGLTALITKASGNVQVRKEGGAFAAIDSAQGEADAGAPYDALGYYTISLSVTDTNTLGNLRVALDIAGALPVSEDCFVVTAAAWNARFGVTDPDPLAAEVPGSYAQGTAGYALGQVASGDGTYTNTVEYPAGTPVAGATVTAYADEDCVTTPKQTVVTNDLGSFTLRLPVGTYYIRITHPTYVSEIVEVEVV